jgi:RHS repeat-associated protein
VANTEGEEIDEVTSLDYVETRYYSGAQGRFTSPDPLPWLHWQRAGEDDRARFQDFISGPQNLNLYAYTRNNPLRFGDSSRTNEPPPRFGAVGAGSAFHAGFHRARRCSESRVGATIPGEETGLRAASVVV